MKLQKTYKSSWEIFAVGILATIGKIILYVVMLVGGIVLNIFIDNPLIVAGISFVANFLISRIRNK